MNTENRCSVLEMTGGPFNTCPKESDCRIKAVMERVNKGDQIDFDQAQNLTMGLTREFNVKPYGLNGSGPVEIKGRNFTATCTQGTIREGSLETCGVIIFVEKPQ